MENRLILAINPGSTSTKIAVFENTKTVFVKNIKHEAEILKKFEKITDQFSFRKNIILEQLKNADIVLEHISVIVGRGGLLKPIPSGVYKVNEVMIEDLKKGVQGQHASNLGGLIAYDLASHIPGAVAFIADPVVVDELQDVARIAGHPIFQRKSIFHALNQKAVARLYANTIGKSYDSLNLIVAHMGGGISVGAHQKGSVIDVNQSLNGEGPMTPERSGSLPMGDLISLCFSGKYTEQEVWKMLTGEGGYVAYFGTNDAYAVELMAKDGNPKAILIQKALGYQVSKYIGAMATVLKGHVDCIILTGGLANNKILIEYISQHIGFIAPIHVHPGEDEMGALAYNALRVLNGETEIKIYS